GPRSMVANSRVSGWTLWAAVRVSFQGLRLAPPFAEDVSGIGTQALVALHLARGPGDLGGFGAGGIAQAEVQPRVARGLVASPPGAPGHEASATRDDRDPGAVGVAVGLATLQAEGERPAPFGPVVEVGQRLVVRLDQHVLPTVVVEVAHDQAATHAWHAPGRAGAVGDVGQASVGAGYEKLRGHQVRVVRPEVVDVPIRRGQIEPPIVVGVEEGDTEAQQATAGDGQPDRGSRVGEDAAAQVTVVRRRLAIEVGYGQVDEPVPIE